MEEENTYGSRGQSTHLTCSHFAHILLPGMKILSQRWQFLRTLCIGFFMTKSCPPVFEGRVSTYLCFLFKPSIASAPGPFWPPGYVISLPLPPGAFFLGYLGHCSHRSCP